MPINMIEKKDGRTLEVFLTKRLTKEDMKEFVPVANRMIAAQGKINVMVVMHDFEGLEPGAVWEDVKWDSKHYHDVGRVAFVGEKKWQETMSKLSSPFTAAEVSYFDTNDVDNARNWVEETVPTTA